MTDHKFRKTFRTDKTIHYAIRTLKFGVGSVAISSSVLFLSPFMQSVAQADDLSPETSTVETLLSSNEESTAIASQENPSAETSVTTVEEVLPELETTETQASLTQTDLSETTETAELLEETTSLSTVTESSEVKETPAISLATDSQIKQETTVAQDEDQVQDGYLRLHFESLPSDNLATLGLWTWDDVAEPSSNWPSGATSFTTAKTDSYGYYMDVKLSEVKRDKLGFLINNVKGDNISQDRSIDLISPDMKEAWIDRDYGIHTYEPIPAGTLRINYYRSDGQYDKKSIWTWGDVTQPSSGTFPDGYDFVNQGLYGYYIDIALTDDARNIGFLLLDETKSGDDAKIRQENYNFSDLKNHSQIFLRDDDANIYTNPYYINTIRMTGAQHISQKAISASFTNLEGADKTYILANTSITDKNGESLAIADLDIDSQTKRVTYYGDFSQANSPYQINYNGDTFTTSMSWQLKDELYQYDGQLGASVSQNGQVVDMTLWSPSADQVNVIIYDKDDQDLVIGKVAMQAAQAGTWQVTLDAQSNLGITDYRGYFYHYEIIRDGASYLVLDPYAKSLAAWNSDIAKQDAAHKVAKAAFVDPSDYDIAGLTYANIPGFTSREDAIIYEAHVRDFTSDPSISSELQSQFGTFSAFVERLDYLKDLGVTHIQLLPIMSYYNVNEYLNSQRLTDYASSNSNYNWGYDPQSYFALSGMYSSDPSDPGQRILEFKNLVNEIHKRGMGVILDVVYNHTALLDIFEDLEPNYYHFMDADGTPRTSFGGGRLGTTHYMSRRVLVDSIKYLVDEYKVDGFRFDMMGDHDASSIESAYQAAKELNPNIIMLGEGWLTYAGDENLPEQPADQTWMASTDTVAVFSDDIRNSLKSGYPSEGTPAFITGGAKNIQSIFNNIKAQPNNFTADDPGDVIQYIAAHDNLTLFDVIAQSIKKDPSIAENNAEIHRRLRLGNLLVLTAQGTPFIHSGQEYGRTKQFLDPAYETVVSDDKVPNKSHLLVDENGQAFDYPYFIHDSYDSSDSINRFDWTKATDSSAYPENTQSHDYTKGLIALRRSTDAFSLKTLDAVNQNVSLISPASDTDDLVIAYQTIASNGDIYAVFVNADSTERSFSLEGQYQKLAQADIIVDGQTAGIEVIENPVGVSLSSDSLSLAPLTATVLRLKKLGTAIPDSAPSQEEKPQAVISFKRYSETEEILPSNQWQVDTNLTIGQEKLIRIGQVGYLKRYYEDTYIDDQLVEHKLISQEEIPATDNIWLVGSQKQIVNEQVSTKNTSSLELSSKESESISYQKVQEDKLPETGSHKQTFLSLLGVSLLSLIGFSKIGKTRKH
ncbi:pullulanase [Streptococcus loxodontisalivarius]|uniref:pullulanase n=1 Tax=Streptococcus loxodontisalivarius TaxID=1349415 RepID=A0ABS2PS25_9STRE|nr:pullulanase [Streptococcus loxodontisalivarius]MBM7642728.1 secreted pullulanase [Streptococcus loxodontisalivarius]